MSEEKKPDPKTVEIPTAKKVIHRLLCADYLETIAVLVRNGMVTEFDFVWDLDDPKPVGSIVAVAGFLHTPLEIKMVEAQQEENRKEQESQKIQVFDVEKDVKNHESCEDPRCIACQRDPQPS
jgi:hypothetical protein